MTAYNNSFEELVNKWIIRSEPYIHKNGIVDNSFIDEPIKVERINSDSSFIYKLSFVDTEFTMPKEWNDGNWIEYL